MGKTKKSKLKKQPTHPYRKPSKPAKPPNGTKPKTSTCKNSPRYSQKQGIPFSPTDRILLIGEGDFSFALSLLTHHACTSLTATTFETQSTLAAKHPQSAAHIAALEAAAQRVIYSVDATKLGLPLTTGGGSSIRKTRWDRIIFNFPHVGGLTKDVNRQVRANQELLVLFLARAKALLARRGTVIVTVFEGQPYELWNLRDLGRHVGLKVVRSLRFEAGLYKGYRHARTMGNVQGGGGWKGEEREARTYIFGVNGEEGQVDGTATKRKADEDDEGSEDDNHDYKPSTD